LLGAWTQHEARTMEEAIERTRATREWPHAGRIATLLRYHTLRAGGITPRTRDHPSETLWNGGRKSWKRVKHATRDRRACMYHDHCLLDRDGHVLIVTLNRPEARNALSSGMLAGMYRAWRMLDEDAGLRVAILTGRGDVFCAGADLKSMGAGE